MDGSQRSESGRSWSAVGLTTLSAIIALQQMLLGCVRVYVYPELLVYPYLTSVGFLPYREILDQHFPGLMFFPVNFHTLGLRDAWSFHLLLMAVAAAVAASTYAVALRLAGEPAALLAALAYAAWQPFFEGDQLWLDTFLPLFTLPAFLLVLDARWLLAGLLLGAGVVFKQTLVPLVAFAGLLVLREGGWRGACRFAAGALLPSALMLAHLQRIGVLTDFWFWAVGFNLTAYAAAGTLAPRVGDVIRVALPVASMLAAIVVAPPRWRPGLVAAWACFTVVGGVGRFGLVHLQPAVPYFAVLLAFLVVEAWRRRATAALVALLVLVPVWLGDFYGRRARWLEDAAEGRRLASIEELIREGASPADEVLLLGVPPQLYASTRTVPPGRVFAFPFPWFIDAAGSRLLEAQRVRPPKLVLIDTEAGIDGRLLRDYARELVDDVRARHELASRLGSVEVYGPGRR